jgi:hypothetical protein
MLAEKYDEEELQRVFREEELEVMKNHYESHLAAKRRFASLKGTVLGSPLQDSSESNVSRANTLVIAPSVTLPKPQENSIPPSTFIPTQPASIESTVSASIHKTDNIPSKELEAEQDEEEDSRYISYEKLLQGKTWPPGIDPTAREQYLSPKEFQRVFKMNMEDFNKLGKFMRIRLKKEVYLF